ncbi:DMT family transporter [Microbacterium resistens]
MKDHSSATIREARPLSISRAGLAWGFLGVLAFSFTVPMTRVAVGAEQMSPLFVGSGRAVVAALLAAAALAVTRQRRPRGREWLSVAVVGAGAVVGFPLLTSFALTEAPARHGAVVVALLPAATAVVAVLRTRERPGRAFWAAAVIGAIAAMSFAALQSGGVSGMRPSDGLLFAAVAVCAIAYAEGGVLSRTLGSWQTISWALVAASPVMTILTGAAVAAQPPSGSVTAWLAFAYLGVVSMFLGFFAWYRGLAIGPLAQISQVQLAQPVLSIAWAALLLREPITVATVLGGGAVIGAALLAVRSRARRPPGPEGDAKRLGRRG